MFPTLIPDPFPVAVFEEPACNGLTSICGKRFDKVSFPGTHNSGLYFFTLGFHSKLPDLPDLEVAVPSMLFRCQLFNDTSGGSRISPRRGRQLPSGAPTYDFVKISQKIHEIERIWTPGGGGRVQNFTM